MKGKKLRRFANLALMFGVDTANGEDSVSGVDFVTEEDLDPSVFDTQERILDDEAAFNNEYQFEVNYSTGGDYPEIIETPPPTSNIGDDIHGAPTSKRDVPPVIPPPITSKRRRSAAMEESCSALQEMAACLRKIVVDLDRQAAMYEKEVGDKASVDIKEVLDITKNLTELSDHDVLWLMRDFKKDNCLCHAFLQYDQAFQITWVLYRLGRFGASALDM